MPQSKPSATVYGTALREGLLACGGAAHFATKGYLAKALYARGVDFQILTVWRALLSLPLFFALAIARGTPMRLQGWPRREVLLAAGAGALCYGIGALVDFYALQLIDASMERALLFSYPAVIVLITAVRRRAWPARTTLLAASLTYLGILLVIGGLDVHEWRGNAYGAVLVLGCAVTTALYFLAGERCVPALGSLGYTLIAMTAATLLVSVHYVATRPLGALLDVPVAGSLLLVALAVLCMLLPTLMQAEGIRLVGAERGAIFSTAGPPTTLLLGIAFFAERPSAWQLGGTALILVGITLIVRRTVSRRAA